MNEIQNITETVPSKHQKALIETQWCLQEAFKIAVRHRGVTDWSDQVSNGPTAERDVEVYQIEIAKMIQRALYNESRTPQS